MPAYGGSLFDPARFPFLTATTEHGTLAITVSDRVMLHVLRSVQQADAQGREARRISFRDIDVEQIGYIYEGLLGYTAVTVDETYLGLQRHRRRRTGDPARRRSKQLAAANTDPKKLADGDPRLGRGGPAVRQTASRPRRSPKASAPSAEPSVVSALDAGRRRRPRAARSGAALARADAPRSARAARSSCSTAA